MYGTKGRESRPSMTPRGGATERNTYYTNLRLCVYVHVPQQLTAPAALSHSRLWGSGATSTRHRMQ